VIAELARSHLLALSRSLIEVALGVSLQQARQALESLDHEALGALGLGLAPTRPHCRCTPCRRSRGLETSRKKIASA